MEVRSFSFWFGANGGEGWLPRIALIGKEGNFFVDEAGVFFHPGRHNLQHHTPKPCVSGQQSS